MDERQRIRLDTCEKITLAAKSESVYFLKPVYAAEGS